MLSKFIILHFSKTYSAVIYFDLISKFMYILDEFLALSDCDGVFYEVLAADRAVND